MKNLQHLLPAMNGGNNESASVPFWSSGAGKWTVAALIIFFILNASLADFWLSKKSYFATYTCSFKNFTILHPLPRSWYAPGGAGQEDRSLPYLALLRFIYALIPDRLLSLRATSVLVSCISLFFLYRLALILFSRPIALLFLFLLVTSPIYLESMRAFGYQSLTHLIVVVICYLSAAVADRKRAALKIVLIAVFCVLTLSLYIGGRIAVILPVIFFGLYPRKNWAKLLLFLLVFTGLLALLEVGYGRPILNLKEYFFTPQEQGTIWIAQDGKFSPALLRDHLKDNLRWARGYLLSQGRRPFADRDRHSRLFNPAYTPFFLLGFIVCLLKRKRNNIFLLLLFLLFFVVPMASEAIQPRRILLSLYPAYLLISLGFWGFYQLLAGMGAAPAWRFVAGCAAVAFLLVSGGYNLREFFFQVAKPYYHFPAEQLKKIAAFVAEKRKEVSHIRYYKRVDELTMGNPYFIPHPEPDQQVANIFGEERYDMRPCLSIFLTAVGEDLLYLYTVPAPPHFAETIEWARKNLAGVFSESSLSGTPLNYVMLKYSTVAPNVLFREGEELKVTTSGNFSVVSPEAKNNIAVSGLLDGRPESSWEVLLAGGRGPGWIMFDFGEGNGQSIKSLVARPAASKLKHFFRTAALLGSSDGSTWEMLAPILQREPPVTTDWIRWDLDNNRSYRYYKFELSAGPDRGSQAIISIGDLMMFDRPDRKFFVENLF